MIDAVEEISSSLGSVLAEQKAERNGVENTHWDQERRGSKYRVVDKVTVGNAAGR